MTYTLTELEQTLNFTFGPRRKKPKWASKKAHPSLPRAFVMTDTKRLPNPIEIVNNLPRDVTLIFRHYEHNERRKIACQLIASAHRQGLKVLIAGDILLAREINADGVHLPSHMLVGESIRQLKNTSPNWLITAAIHKHQEMLRAQKLPIDAMLVSPIYMTTTRVLRKPLGPLGLRRIASRSHVPIFALGGLDRKNLSSLKNTGAIGFAGISEFLAFF